MNTKILTGAGCLLLLVAAMTPVVLGHDDRVTSDVNNDYPGASTSGDGVSGRYVGAAGPATADESDYRTTISGGSMLCDLEVLNFDPTDEYIVDGHSLTDPSFGSPENYPGTMPEFWDDGGFGGACHTDYGVPNFQHYDTPGCSGTAWADNNLGDPHDVWIGASCDWKTTNGGTPSIDIFLTCIANALISDPDLSGDEAIACVEAYLACTTAVVPEESCTAGGTEVCGADNVADGINYGHGQAGVPYPTFSSGAVWPYYVHQGDVFNDVNGVFDADCTAVSTAAVFVFDAVNTNHYDVMGGTPTVHPAGSGEIWST